jgi:small subunit ribosomal protein S1
MELERDELEKLYADTFRGLEEGTIIKGKVIQIQSDGVMVDIGYKCEGFIPGSEFTEDEISQLNVDDMMEVYVSKIKTSDGIVYLSKEKAEKERKWILIEEAHRKGKALEGKIKEMVKGGLIVDLMGINAFLPGSHIDIKATRDMESLIGKVLPFKVLKINHKRSNIIVSRRVILEEEREQLRSETLSKLTEGAIVQGIIKNLTDYGAFVDLGGIDGLLHISDMSWGKITNPEELFKVREPVEVVVLNFDRENEKVTLGYKQKKPDPWSVAEENYPPGLRVKGKVISVVDYGIFIELEEGLEGLVHVSEFDWLDKMKKPSKHFSMGDIVEAVVLQVDSEEHRISLSIKQATPNPWEVVGHKYSVGQKITGKVRSFTDFGAFITLDEGVDALLHISDMSWTRHIKHPSDILKKGQSIEAIVLSVDPEKERMSLGLKQLTPDLWDAEIPSHYHVGLEVTGRILKIAECGLFITFNDDIEGLIYASEIDVDQSARLEDKFNIGDEVKATIIKVDTSERKIGLSMKQDFTGRNE